MNRSKDVNYPESATQEPGVYETSDIDSDNGEEPHDIDVNTNEDIIETEIEFEKSHQKFLQEFTNGKINFDYASNLSLYDSGYKVQRQETHKQKLSRISKELYGLKADMDARDEEIESGDKLKELIDLVEKMGHNPKEYKNPYKEEINKLFERVELHVESDHQTSESMESSDPLLDSNRSHSVSHTLVQLDNKVSALEMKLGTINHPIDNIINDLTRKINVINNPQYQVEEIKTSINSLLTSPEYQKIVNRSRGVTGPIGTTGTTGTTGTKEISHLSIAGDDENDSILANFKSHKLDELINYLPELNSFNHEKKLLLKRLKMLNQIHLNLDNSVDFVSKLDDLINDLSTNINNWNENLVSVNKKLDGHIETFNENRTVIETWVNDLSKKVDEKTK